jgi:hypothetical protein
MAKKTNLAAALAANKEEAAPPAPTITAPAAVANTSASKTGRAPSRAGQTNVSGWFDMPVKHTLEELRLARQKQLGRRVTIQEIMGEAFNDIFKKYGFPEVAPTRGKD